MIRMFIAALAATIGLGACVPATETGFSRGATDIAAQRMRFATEAVCLNNRTRTSQDRAARSLNFPVREREGNAIVYVNPGTLTFLRIGPAPDQAVFDEAGNRTVVSGSGCSVGSPAVGTRLANRLAGEILAPLLVDGSDTLLSPIGAGTNRDGGAGFFFDNLAVTLPLARTTFTDPATGDDVIFDHPVILIVHN